MIFFFGTRSSKIKERRLKRTTCSYCQSQDSFTVNTYGTYFHLFWIPLFPLFKKHIAECNHCKKSFSFAEFTPQMLKSLEVENNINPAKRPIWQGCGCLILTVFFLIVFSISLYGVYTRSGDSSNVIKVDPRKELLDADFKKMTQLLQRGKDSISISLKTCVDYNIVSGLETENISYFTRQNEDKLLVLLKIKDIKKVKAEFRKDILDIVEDCIFQLDKNKIFNELYIGVEGKWNTVLIRTPTQEDISGRFADKYKLLSFYGNDSLKQSKTKQPDTLKIE
ncbi:zinc-ribbon domain-containing protein [Zobellia amurskyensis]|uniref:Zinc-ribbon domain-containing protein n=1 Tax=Zobellia amurskyensis TaxID=248905 RepID=A0A7X3D367_9FLAO|nr:zinc-ribbon domain-containing protein [Zobellia amurskyensis]MUH37355.1 zinc-ribbon domain-containing protein [Zobellia amurskyensis]